MTSKKPVLIINFALAVCGCSNGNGTGGPAPDDTLALLSRRWEVSRVWFNGTPVPYLEQQARTIIEFKEDNTFRSETMGIAFGGEWEFTGGGKREIKTFTTSTTDTVTHYRDQVRVYVLLEISPDTLDYKFYDERLQMSVRQVLKPIGDEVPGTRPPELQPSENLPPESN